MSKKTAGCLIALVLAVMVAVLAFVNSPFYPLYRHMFVTERMTFAIPDSSIQIEHARIGTHMLAEYDRWLTVVADGKKFQQHELAVDTCGGYPINCYLIQSESGMFLRLDDAVSEHLVNLSDGTVLISEFGRNTLGAHGISGNYIGNIDGKLGELRFMPASKAAETKVEHLWDR